MEKVELFKENNKVIKTVTNFEDFKDVIRVFCEKPYYEILSDKDCEEEYNLYVEKGIVLGCYIDNKIVGINCIVNEADKNHSIVFPEGSKVAYYSGLAVKENCREHGSGKLLVYHTDKYLNDLKMYDYSYARILCKGSMSQGIFYKNGFRDAYDLEGKLIVDIPEYQKNTESNILDERKYMVKKLVNDNPRFKRR